MIESLPQASDLFYQFKHIRKHIHGRHPQQLNALFQSKHSESKQVMTAPNEFQYGRKHFAAQLYKGKKKHFVLHPQLQWKKTIGETMK